jgi:uncharacterized membrane protein YbhN (UPF0104 family)
VSSAPTQTISAEPRSRRGARLQIFISLVSLAAVVWWAVRQDAPAIPQTASGVLAVALALAVYALATLARAERWYQILDRAAIGLGRAASYRLTVVGYMGNNILPARGGDLLRVLLLHAVARAPRRTALGTVVAERLLDVIALALIFVVVGIGVVREVAMPGGRSLAIGSLAALALFAAAAFVIARAGPLERMRDFVRPVLGAPRNLASGHGVALLGLSVVLWALEALVYFAVARAVGLDLDPFGALYLVALTNLFALVPAAPGYIGTFDAAVVFGARTLGADGSEAVAYLLLLRFVLFVPITLVGLVFLVRRYGGWSGYRAAHAEVTSG